MKHTIRSKVENGKLIRNRKQLNDVVSSFEGKEISITVEKAKKHRSNQQNRYMWGCLLPIVQQGLLEATGELRSVESIHYGILLKMFAPEREIVNTNTGEVITEAISSSEMSTVEFMSYIQDIQKWAAEFLGIDIPSPNEETTLNFD